MSQLRSSKYIQKTTSTVSNKLGDILLLNLSESSAFRPYLVLLFYQLEPLKSTSTQITSPQNRSLSGMMRTNIGYVIVGW